MLDKYIKINEKVIESKQTSSGIWYCNKVSAENVKEMDKLISDLNKLYNKYNKKEKVSHTLPKEKSPEVKGLN